MGEYPTITDSQAIGLKAEAIFRTLLPPPQWIVNKVEQDFGIDFRVEVATDGQLRGCDFFVQVKGFSPALNQINSSYDIQILCSTARYWKEKLLPIMIVAINVNTGEGHFLWFDKSSSIPKNQKMISMSIPLNKDELLDYKIIYSLAPFWEQWVEEVQDAGKVAIYRKLLSDTLGAFQVLLNTYDALLFAPANLLDNPEIIKKVRDDAVGACYTVITKWLHDVTLYTKTGLGVSHIDRQILFMIAKSQRELEKVIAPVSEMGGFGLALRNQEQSIPQLTQFRRIFFEIVDFLSRQNVISRAS